MSSFGLLDTLGRRLLLPGHLIGAAAMPARAEDVAGAMLSAHNGARAQHRRRARQQR